jgi:hypothetical protein
LPRASRPRIRLCSFLGDIYERGTFTENLNHYGVSAMDDPAGATLWGVTTMITQPTVGNHEAKDLAGWRDYWHGHPAHLSFRFGGVLFLDLDAMSSFAVGSTQYKFVKDSLSSAPRCVVAFWHHPVFWADVVDASRKPIWKLLANHGGDLVLNGHHHSMAVYEALDANFQPGGHMVEIVSGAGGAQPRWVGYRFLRPAAVDEGENGGGPVSDAERCCGTRHRYEHQLDVQGCGWESPSGKLCIR